MGSNRFQTSVLAASLAVLGAGCDLASDSNLVHVLTTHHATPEDGSFPNLGDAGESRVFYTDLDWRITFTAAYVVTADVQLQRCSGEIVDLEMYRGPLPEDLRTRDLDTYSLGGEEVPGGPYCRLLVQYGPYLPEPGSSDQRFASPESEEVQGATLYLAGLAEKGRDEVRFEFRSEEPITAALDISTLANGGPVSIDPSSLYPLELTTSKTYDRFLDGIDFLTMQASEVEADLVLPLADQTQVDLGSRIVID